MKEKNINIVKSNGKPSLEEQRLKDREMKRGIFKYHEVPGGVLRFPFKKYKNDPVEHFELYDGQIYSLPLGVAKHLNDNCWYPEYDFIPGDNSGVRMDSSYVGNVAMRAMKKIRRTSFSPLEFMSEEDFGPSNIVQVEQVMR